MSNCPFCGTDKVSKTFNFNEYTCDLCECDYKHTSDGTRIFQEGSWANFCNSITEAISSKVDATVVDLVSKTMRGYSKRDPSEIDLVIESLSSIASTLNSEMKIGLRNKKDFLAVMEQIDSVVKAAHTLHKRQEDLGIRIKLSEGVLDWFKGESDESPMAVNTDGADKGNKIDLSNTPLGDDDDRMSNNFAEGAMSDLDIIAQEAVEALGESAAEDEAVIAYIQENHPDSIEHLNLILQSVHDKVAGGEVDNYGDDMTDVEADADTLASAGMGTDEDYGGSNEMGYDESANQKVIDELVPIYKLEKLDDPNAKPDLGIEAGDEVGDDEIDVQVSEDEDPFAAEGGDSVEGGEEGDIEDTAVDGDATDGEEAPSTEDVLDNEVIDGDSNAIADVQDAAETVQDKFKRLEGKIDDLLGKVQSLTGEESAETEVGDESTGGEDPFASDGGEELSTEGGDGEQPVEGGESDATPAEGNDTGVEDPFAESIVSEAFKKKKIGKITTRGDGSRSSYQRKVGIEDGNSNDMDAEVEEEDIPFTEGPKNQMEKDTDSDAPGATKKPTGEVSYREGFNGFRVGDEVVLEGSADTWSILGIQKNVFTLGRGKTTTKIDVFKESVRHTDSRLEWQATSELMGESKNVWERVSANYVTDKEEKVTGVVGLGGGNRIGGQKFGSKEELSESTSIPVIETTAADRKEVYKYVKDNSLHRLAREVAVQRVCERFTNPVEEINNIVDDAILSEDAAQVETIDSQYGYNAAPIGEHALRQAFQKGWQSVVESEAKEAKPAPKKVVNENRGVGYYRTNDDNLIDGLGRTAAERLMGK